MKIKVSESSGNVLDYLVAKCEGKGEYYLKWWNIGGDRRFTHCIIMSAYSTSWSEGGPIIDREKIYVLPPKAYYRDEWNCSSFDGTKLQAGETALIAAMRCYVESKLGNEVDVPDELNNTI